LAVVGSAGPGVAAAASLLLSSRSLTTYAAASSVPLSSCTLTPVADSYVAGNILNTGSNFGTATTLSVRSDVLGDRRTFVRFDLSQCADAAQARVTSAELRLYLSAAPSATRTYDVYRVTAAWAENGITWSNQPGTAASATAGAPTGTASGITLAWGVASDVQAFVDGASANFGWALRDRTEASLTARTGTFTSRDDATVAQRPKLVLAYYP
jgi:hypothetical protein